MQKSGSIVTTAEEAKQLQDWVEESASGKVRFELLWKGTRDGFGASVFHAKCNNKGPTLTVIKSNNDKIFGGYTSIPWVGSGTSKHDATAFIYSLSHKTKCATQKDTYSIWMTPAMDQYLDMVELISTYTIIAMRPRTIFAPPVLMPCLRVRITPSWLDLTHLR